MKSLFSVVNTFYSGKQTRNLRVLFKFLISLLLLVLCYSAIFQYLMGLENQEHSWISAIYWCLVVMSTLGFGDITFHSDIGRAFSMIVLLSGTFFMLIMLPFFFIQFFFVPWMESQANRRAPRKVPSEMKGHVILTGLGEVEAALIKRLKLCDVPYVIIISDIAEALLLHDQGYNVMIGDLDDVETYSLAKADHAAMVACLTSDTVNTNIAFTVREVADKVLIVATANSPASVDILELAGCNRVLELSKALGLSFAKRILGKEGKAHIIGEFGELKVAEALVVDPLLVGKPLRELGLRSVTNVTIVGTWDRGKFELAGPETILSYSSVIILTGSREQLHAFDERFGGTIKKASFVLIIGGGRVGRAVAEQLMETGIAYNIIDKDPARIRSEENYTLGDAADLEVLKLAGIDRASTVLVTTHDDDMNVYLSIYCRRLRPDIQLISRANVERNVSTLHRAGADFVLSYSGVGANALFNELQRMDTLLLAEGLIAFRVRVPSSLGGKSLQESRLRESTGCSVVAVSKSGHFDISPNPHQPLPGDGELVIIGDAQAESRFMERFPFENLAKLRKR